MTHFMPIIPFEYYAPGGTDRGKGDYYPRKRMHGVPCPVAVPAPDNSTDFVDCGGNACAYLSTVTGDGIADGAHTPRFVVFANKQRQPMKR